MEPMALYLETIIGMASKLPLSPLDPTGQESTHITLEQVYVGMDMTPPQTITYKGKKGEARSVLAAVATHKRLVLLGDPGSGKSTFLRFLALRLAQARLTRQPKWLAYLSWPVYPTEKEQEITRRHQDEDDERLGRASWPRPAYVPVMVTLRDFAATDFNPASPKAVWNFIGADLSERGLADTIPAVREALRYGQGIFLLDGVDEVPPERRPLVWQAIGRLAESAFNRCPWITTCRSLSYVDVEVASAGATGQVHAGSPETASNRDLCQRLVPGLDRRGAGDPRQR